MSNNSAIVASYVQYQWLRAQMGMNMNGVISDMRGSARVARTVGDEATAHELETLAEAMAGGWSVPELLRALNGEKAAA